MNPHNFGPTAIPCASWRRRKVFALLFFCLFCAACARTEGGTEIGAAEQPDVENCPVIYVLAPANYIVDIAADARVRLDPAWHEFELFCSLAEAGEALGANIRQGRSQPEQWRIYTLEGDVSDLVKYENGRRVLAQPAILSGWENWPPERR